MHGESEATQPKKSGKNKKADVADLEKPLLLRIAGNREFIISRRIYQSGNSSVGELSVGKLTADK
jgi:hypothetical protein